MEKILESYPSLESMESGKTASINWVSCIIRKEKLDTVMAALSKLNLVGGLTVTPVRGFGRQMGSLEPSLKVPQGMRFIDKVKLEIAVPSDELPHVTSLLSHLAYTGRVGDGKIFIQEIMAATRIRTGEKGVDAL